MNKINLSNEVTVTNGLIKFNEFKMSCRTAGVAVAVNAIIGVDFNILRIKPIFRYAGRKSLPHWLKNFK